MTDRPQTTKDADPGLVMTPMIDIVFQLLIFFLLSLRFKTVDRRIESALPLDRGIDITAVIPPQDPAVRLSLTRRARADGAPTATEIRLGRVARIALPPRDGRARDVAAARLEEVFRRQRLVLGADVHKAEIETPGPGGALVPHGDVIRVLDALISAGLTDIAFEGSASLPN